MSPGLELEPLARMMRIETRRIADRGLSVRRLLGSNFRLYFEFANTDLPFGLQICPSAEESRALHLCNSEEPIFTQVPNTSVRRQRLDDSSL